MVLRVMCTALLKKAIEVCSIGIIGSTVCSQRFIHILCNPVITTSKISLMIESVDTFCWFVESSNEVEVPVVNPVVPKKAKPVEGELTTFPGTHVTVLPSGVVVVKKIGLTEEDKEMGMSDSDWEDFNSDEEVITSLYLCL